MYKGGRVGESVPIHNKTTTTTTANPPSQANFAYSRYSLIHPEIAAMQATLEAAHVALVEATDQAFLELWATGEADKAQALIDEVCVNDLGCGGGKGVV
jgi:hypothetical protein